ncbi:Fic family protein [Candidatus Harpocratesius sp.]
MQIRKKKGHYYLIHSYREQKVKNFERYIGKEYPTNTQIEQFIYDYFKIRWLSRIVHLQKLYNKKIKNMSSTLSEKNLRSFGIRFTHNTNRIEGSTLTEIDTRMLLDYDQLPINTQVNKKASDIIETKAHMLVYEEMLNTQQPLSMELILSWHKKIFGATQPNHAGQIRNGPIFIAGSNYVPPSSRYEVDLLLDELFQWYYKNLAKYNPTFIAAVFHYKFVSIHPFEDGNGRITRLITNFILYKHNYPMFDIEAKYRISYFRGLEKANQENNPMRFIGWFYPHYIRNIEKILKKYGILL